MAQFQADGGAEVLAGRPHNPAVSVYVCEMVGALATEVARVWIARWPYGEQHVGGGAAPVSGSGIENNQAVMVMHCVWKLGE